MHDWIEIIFYDDFTVIGSLFESFLYEYEVVRYIELNRIIFNIVYGCMLNM